MGDRRRQIWETGGGKYGRQEEVNMGDRRR